MNHPEKQALKPDKYFEEAQRLSERELYRSGIRAIKHRQPAGETVQPVVGTASVKKSTSPTDSLLFPVLSLVFAPLFGIGTYLLIELYAPDFEAVILGQLGSKPAAYLLLSITCLVGIFIGRMVYQSVIGSKNRKSN